MGLPLPKVVSDVGPGGPLVTAMGGMNALQKQMLENQYYGPNIESQMAQRNALTNRYNTLTPLEANKMQISNQYLPDQLRLANANQALQNQFYAPNMQSQINQRNAQTGAIPSEIALRQAQLDKINYMLKHPGLMGGNSAKDIQSLIDLGVINKNSLNQQGSGSPINAGQQGNDQSSYAPFNTGNPTVNAILNKPYADVAYRQKMTQGYNWNHLPVETKNQLTAQGYGMGVEPLKMMNYINQGMSLPEIAKAEGLDPENLPPPVYAPTTATKTRVQQVEQVGRELDYLSSASTPLIKQYANTFAGISGDRLSDMMSNNPEAQKRFGQYIGALSIQSGLANGRVLLEGGRPGVEVMRMVKDGALKGIDQHSPIRMTKVAYQAAQDTIDNILQKGAKIRTSTGMNPFSEISKSKNKASLKPVSEMTTEEIKAELARGAK